MNRRRFLQSAAAAYTLASLPRFGRGAEASSPRKFRTALIGSGWWGNNILREAMASGSCEVVALCDVDTRQLETTLANVRGGTGDTPKIFKDYRDLLDQT